MDLLRRALHSDTGVTLDAAALALASIECPDLDPARYIQVLDEMACELDQRLKASAGPQFLEIANHYLFDELGFQGNQADYNDPRNSCVNEVLDRKLGLPITLSVVYIEVARRLGRPVSGIGLPGHFIVRYDDGVFSSYVDPFHSGKLLSENDCLTLAREITGVEMSAEPSVLAPVGVRYIIVRMLNNLRAAYFRKSEWAKAAVVLDVLIEEFPSNGEYYKARGAARLKLRKLGAARNDFETYLKHSPDAQDSAEVTRQLQAIHRWLGRLN
jgi:regulator of sirC expression with transglutaminase-like and TPR domain